MDRNSFRPDVPLDTKAITPEAVKLRLGRCLSRIIGPGGRYSYDEAARKTGINARTLRAYADGLACPTLARYQRLLRAFGPEVGAELAMMLGWQPRASIQEVASVARLEQLRQDVAEALAAVTARNRSGSS